MEHLKQLKEAARIYCRATGIDPDKGIPVPHPTLQGVARQRPMWEIQAERMWDLQLMLAAMNRAKKAANDAEAGHA